MKGTPATQLQMKWWQNAKDAVSKSDAVDILELIDAYQSGELTDDDGCQVFTSRTQVCRHIMYELPKVPQVKPNWLLQQCIWDAEFRKSELKKLKRAKK